MTPEEICADALFKNRTYRGYDAETLRAEWLRTENLYRSDVRAMLTALSTAGFVVVPRGHAEKLLQDVEEQILHERGGLTAEQIARFPPNYCDGYDEGLAVAIGVVDDVRKAMLSAYTPPTQNEDKA